MGEAARGASFAGFVGRRLAALAFTVVMAPTIAWTVFTGLSGTAGQSLPATAADYVVTTFWHFDLGRSVSYGGLPVSEIVWWSLPADLAMVAGALVAGIALGVAGGLVSVRWPRSVGVRALELVTAFVLSSPPYWLGFMVLIFFAPGTGYLLEVPFVSGLQDYVGLTEDPLGWLKALWLPWVLAGLPLAAGVLRITVATLRDTAGEEFLRTAHAKGLREWTVLRRHALPLTVAPVAALTGANMAILITNIALMESAFNIPGIYREIRSVFSYADLPLIQGMIIETTALIVLANMAADLLQARVDPRAR